MYEFLSLTVVVALRHNRQYLLRAIIDYLLALYDYKQLFRHDLPDRILFLPNVK